MSREAAVSRECALRRTIVVLSGDHAFGYHFYDKEPYALTSLQSLNLSATETSLSDLWFGGDNEPRFVEIIIDTELDDLDRVKLVDGNAGLFSSISRFRTLWQLKREYPAALIGKLSREHYPEIASILHSPINESYRAFIEHVQNQGIIVSHLTTSTQLLIERLRGCSQTTLLSMPVGEGGARHLLVHKGVALFMRFVRLENTVDNDPLQDTTQYIVDSVLPGASVITYATPKLLSIDDKRLGSLASLLAHLYMRLSTDWTLEQSQQGVLVVTDEPLLGNSLFNVNRRGSKGRSKKLVAKVLKILSASLLPVAKNGYRLTDNPLWLSDLLEPSLHAVKSQLRLVYLRNATILLTVVTFVLVFAASYHGLRHVHALNVHRQLLKQLTFETNAIRSELGTFHRAPFFVAESIQRIQAFNESSVIGPIDIMKPVALTIKRFPDLNLQSIIWVATSPEQQYETVVGSVVHVKGRSTLARSLDSVESVKVELSGLFSMGNDLRENQERLDALVVSLADVKTISNIVIVESPVDAAHTSQVVDEAYAEFNIQFLVSSS